MNGEYHPKSLKYYWNYIPEDKNPFPLFSKKIKRINFKKIYNTPKNYPPSRVRYGTFFW